jgi:uncharacterized protein DUF6259/concanavalin A-like lectin/glucanase superfamily protein/carbohydrate binding protein with CBM6 domain
MHKLIVTLGLMLIAFFGIAGEKEFHYVFDKTLSPSPELLGKNIKISNGILKSKVQGSFLRIPGSSGINFGENGGTLMLVCRFADRSRNIKRYQFMCNKDKSFFLAITDNRYNFSLCQKGKWSIALIGGEPPIENKWVHLVAVARRINEPEQGNVGFKLELYVNGERIMSKFAPCNKPEPDKTTPVTLGNASRRYGFLGDIAEAAFYNRALSAVEIEKLVKSNKFVKSLPPGTYVLDKKLKTTLNQTLKNAKTPLARWAATSLIKAGRNGFRQSELSVLADKLGTLIKTDATDDVFIRKWNAEQNRLILVNTSKLVAMIINGKGKRSFPIAGVFNKMNKRGVFGDKSVEWRITYQGADKRFVKLTNFSKGVKFNVNGIKTCPDGANFKIDWKNTDFRVSCPVSIKAGRIEMGFEVLNKSSDKLITDVTFPAFSFARLPGKDDILVYPHMSGILAKNPTETFSYDKIFPTAHNTMQFRAYYDNLGNGIYFALEDPLGCTKYSSDTGRRKQVFDSWRIPVAYSFGAKGGNCYKQSGKAVIELYKGDWFDAGQVYKRFLREKAAWWIKKLPRKDTPEWFRNNCLSILAGTWQGDKTLLYLRDYFDMEFGVHLVHWTPGKRNWPHFDKASAKTLTLLKSLKQAGIRVWPYSDPRLWATKDSEDLKSDWKYSSHGKAVAVKNKNGSVYTERYGVPCAVICHGTKKGREWMIQCAKKIADYGFDGIYHDQLAGSQPVMCFDPTHGHLANNPTLWLKNGYWKLYKALRKEVREINPDFIHTAEDASDPYLKTVDGYMVWRFFDANHVPLFQSLYAGRVQFVGRLFNHQYPGDWNSSFIKTAEQLVYAEQLGWITLEDIEVASPLRRYIKKIAHLRKALLGYFNEADMLHPLKFKNKTPMISSIWGTCKPERKPVKTAKILHSVWKRKDGRIMIVFANTVNESTSVEPILDFNKKYLFVCREGKKSGQVINLETGTVPAVKLEPYASEVWLLDDSDAFMEGKNIAATLYKIAHFDDGKTLRILNSVRLHNEIKTLHMDGKKYLRVNDAKRFKKAYRRPVKTGGNIKKSKDIVLMVQSGGNISYPNVDFGKHAYDSFEVLVAAGKNNSGGLIEFFTVKDNGSIDKSIGAIRVADTGGWYNFKNVKVPLKEKISGTKNILIKFTGKACCFKGWRVAKSK